MYINVMRYRTGKFAVAATEISKEGKVINKQSVLQNLKREFGANCSEYRVDRKNGAVTHWWTFVSIQSLSQALNKVEFPSQDNEELED